MTSYICRRLIETIVVIFLVSILAFFLLKIMPGDPAILMLGTDATQQELDELRKELWLDRPLVVQYVHWLSNAVRGDLGNSLSYNRPTTELFAERLPVTGYLSFCAIILSVIVGILAGIICAVRRGDFTDQIISLFANTGMAIPVFWLGVLGVYLFGLKLGWLPLYGYTSPFDDFWKSSKQALMPVILLAIPSISVLARQTRSSMLEVLHQDYIRTARSKGLRERIVVSRHALKNALIPVFTLLGLQVRLMVGGSVLVETVFNIPGMGRLLVQGAFTKDFLVVQGGVLVIGLAVCLANLLVDISYMWLDPRVKL